MKIEKEKYNNIVIMRLAGEFEYGDDQNFKDSIDNSLQEGITLFALNMEKVTYLCSMDIAMIMKSFHEIAKKKGRMAICCVQPTVLRMLSITRISVVIPVFTNEKEALASLG